MISSMRSSSEDAVGHDERREPYLFRWPRRAPGAILPLPAAGAAGWGRHGHYRSEASAACGWRIRTALETAQPGVDGCRAGLGTKASDGDMQVGPLIRPLEIGDVGLDLLKLKGSLLVGEVLIYGPRVDVIEGDPLQNALRRVVDGHGHAGHAP